MAIWSPVIKLRLVSGQAETTSKSVRNIGDGLSVISELDVNAGLVRQSIASDEGPRC